jgi:hypothetical protein
VSDSGTIRAWALCWPNDRFPLLFLTEEAAEENRVWFSKNYKTNRDGLPRGEPFIVELAPTK